MRWVLKRLRKFDLFIKLLKYIFFIIKIDFLNYYIDIVDVLINTHRIIIIINQLVLKLFYNV